MTAEEAYAAAEAEGLTLVRAENVAGFKGVSRCNSTSALFQAELQRDGRRNKLGTFASAEEAALAVARFRKAPPSPSQLAAPPQDRKRSASPSPVRSQRSKHR